MEPERKIEKLLRAFAKKRREQAGDAMELPAGARERLQRELSRRESARSGGFFSSFFAGFRPRLAFAVCVIAVAAAGTWLLLPNLTRPKPTSLASANRQMAKVPLVDQPMPETAPPPVVMPSPAVRSEVARDMEKKPAAFSGAATRQLQSAGTAANPSANLAVKEMPSPAPVLDKRMESTNLLARISTLSTTSPDQGILAEKGGEPPADLFANSGVLNKDSADWAASSTRQINTNATMGALTLAAAEPEAQKKPSFGGAPAGAPANGVVFDSIAKQETSPADAVTSQRFYRVDIAARRSAKEAPSTAAPLLTSFRVEQNGGEMRIVDADGSIYTGTVQVANQESESHTTFASTFKSAPAGAAARAPQQFPAAQNYFFRVAGTNRNLRQNVVFSGNLIPLTNNVVTRKNVGAVTGLAGGGGGGAMPAAPMSSLLLNSRISGKAVIGNQKAIDVNATPAR